MAASGVVAVTAAPAFAGTASVGGHDDAIVPTDSGPVRDLLADGYRIFQGIPYAQPPVGELRWRPPDSRDRGSRRWTPPGPARHARRKAWNWASPVIPRIACIST